MVLKKRTYYGKFHGFLAPVIPKAPRSLRRRSLRNKSSGGEVCAFELLAAVAGKLLQESESSTSSISIPKEGVKNEPLEVKVKPERLDNHDQGSCAESELLAQPTKLNPPLTELPESENDSGSEHASFATTSNFINKVGNHLRTNLFEEKNGVNDIPSKPEGGSTSHRNLCDVNFDDNQAELQTEAIDKQSGGLTSVPKKTSSSVHLSFYRDPVHNACFPRHQGDVNINIRDDDEKYFRYYNRNARRRAFGSRSRAGYRKMRKMMTSRYWKVAPKLKDYELANTTSVGVKSFYHKRKNIFMRERFQADAASKRRRLFHHSSKTAYVKEASSESKSNSVKFSIKSFKVPELYVEVPETSTVGSLKRSVMEAVTAILRGKLHVGVLLHGKKVRDDNRTLQQFGISQNCNLESLGFTLEPSLPKASPFLVQKETPSSLQCNTQQQLSRSPSSPVIDGGLSNSSLEYPPVETTLGNYLEKNEESTTLSGEVTTQEPVEDSKALVLVQPVDAEILSMVPLTEKPTKRYELSQRRTRRPFSVSEVEALVEAVEILGAGRWRDVKLRAFGEANHRTYVDLKDKWKTLVHTASISPQQRRGEPVPQDLLDRVLAAHAYWSQHQSKQHSKHQKTVEAPM